MKCQIDSGVMRCLKKVRELRLRIAACHRIAEKFANAGAYDASEQWTAQASRLELVSGMVQANARRLAE